MYPLFAFLTDIVGNISRECLHGPIIFTVAFGRSGDETAAQLDLAYAISVDINSEPSPVSYQLFIVQGFDVLVREFGDGFFQGWDFGQGIEGEEMWVDLKYYFKVFPNSIFIIFQNVP
jgi:hypothetical protein